MASDQSSSAVLAELSSEAQFLFSGNPMATVVCHTATQAVISCNPAACLLFDCTSDGTEIPAFVKRALTNRQMDLLKHLRKDGSEILLETFIHRVAWEGKDAQVLFIADRTDSNSTEKRLAAVEAKAETALKLKNDFLSTMSHDIRTPLNGVIAMAAMLAETELTQEQRDYVNTICSSSELLFTVINDGLDYTKIENQSLTLESLDFDLRVVIEDVLEITGSSAAQKKLNLKSSLAANVSPNLKGDAERLKQVLLNVLSNAIKSTESGCVTLAVTKLDTDCGKLRFQVTAEISGEGLSSFYRGSSQSNPSIAIRGSASGLGFLISKHLVELMGGEIGVTSEQTDQTTLWFTADFAISAREPEAENLTSLVGRKALIVQRSPEERAGTRLLLEGMGLIVTEATNAPQALSLSSHQSNSLHPFSLCLVDSNLPVIDGIKFAGLLRGQQAQVNKIKNYDIKIILMSSARSHRQLSEARNAGVDDILAKPLRHRQVFRCLSDCFSAPVLSVEPESRNETANAKPVSILVVEDNLVNQMVASLCLEKLGYAVQIAEDGLAALDAFSNKRFDLILMDCHMPRMDGATATKKIRAMGGFGESIPILALTADVFQTERDRCIESGMNDFLSKPVRIDILKSKLEYWLNQPR